MFDSYLADKLSEDESPNYSYEEVYPEAVEVWKDEINNNEGIE